MTKPFDDSKHEEWVGLDIGPGFGLPDPEHEHGPGCGHEPAFEVHANDPEVAKRVFMAFVATQMLDMETLEHLAKGEWHLHVARDSGENC